MRSFRNLPIRQKVGAVIMLTTASALVLACGAFIVYDSISLRRSTMNDLKMLATVVAAKSAAAVMFTDAEAATEILSSVRIHPSIVAGAILSNDGHPFVTYGQWSDASLLGGRTVTVFEPIRYKDDQVARLVLVSDLREVRSGVRMKIATGVIVLIIALLFALAMTTGLQRLVTKPLLDLAGAARRVRHEKDFAIRVSEGSGSDRDELVAVQQAFNEMLEEIQARDEALQRHQLQLERDVSARTAELSTAVEHNQAILDSAGEGIFGLDPSGVATFINPSAARILGADVFDLVGRNLHQQMHAATAALADCRICNATLEPAVRTGRATLVRESDGVEVPIEYTSSTIIGFGGAGGVVVTFRDISERLAIERMKDEFVSTVSHELRTPLTAIRGALGLLGAGLLGNQAPKAQRMLEIALSNTERLGRLINDILDLEKMESGRVELNRKPVAAADLLRQAAEALQAMGDRAGVSIEVQASPVELLVDSDRILQLLINLISNAIKFSPSGTTVAVTGRLADDRYIVAVRDEGRGIPDDKLEAIFERFKQVDASDSRDKGGTGLGLAICRTIAEAHGGKIWARRAEPAGSVFTFTLPMPPSPAHRPTRCVVLYEEDERAVPAFAAALEARGLSVIVASSERELCDSAASSNVEAILIDLHNASVGNALLEALQTSNCLNVPIIVTAAEEPAWIGDQVALIASWVPKPASGEVVAEAVLMACAGVDVLVIEDDFDLARVLIAALEESGIRVQHAVTGKDAIAALERHVPSLIVLDLVLPELDGFAVVRWMRTRAPLAHVPMLVYSAREISTTEQQQLTLGPTEFVTKSRVSIEEFEARVAHLLFAVTGARSQEVANAA